MKRILLFASLTAALSLIAGPGSLAQSANEKPTCGGKVATLVFPSTRSQATTIEGTDGDDVIVTGPGTERVMGLQGDDTICTRSGNDTIKGGRGDDKVFGGSGRDHLEGQRGLDRAIGGKGHDTCTAERSRGCEK